MSMRNVMLLIRDLPGAMKFYTEGLGLRVQQASDTWVELRTANNVAISLKQVTSEAQCSTGYSPLINFDIENMDETLPKLLQLGAHLDGPVKYPAFGKIAAIRSPDGHMIGLYEPAVKH